MKSQKVGGTFRKWYFDTYFGNYPVGYYSVKVFKILIGDLTDINYFVCSEILVIYNHLSKNWSDIFDRFFGWCFGRREI